MNLTTIFWLICEVGNFYGVEAEGKVTDGECKTDQDCKAICPIGSIGWQCAQGVCFCKGRKFAVATTIDHGA